MPRVLELEMTSHKQEGRSEGAPQLAEYLSSGYKALGQIPSTLHTAWIVIWGNVGKSSRLGQPGLWEILF